MVLLRSSISASSIPKIPCLPAHRPSYRCAAQYAPEASRSLGRATKQRRRSVSALCVRRGVWGFFEALFSGTRRFARGEGRLGPPCRDGVLGPRRNGIIAVVPGSISEVFILANPKIKVGSQHTEAMVDRPRLAFLASVIWSWRHERPTRGSLPKGRDVFPHDVARHCVRAYFRLQQPCEK